MVPIVLYSTWPDVTSAEACAAKLVDAHLAACVTILPAAQSIFRWEGEMRAEQEAVMLAKTVESQALAARTTILSVHPYQTPCVLCLSVRAEFSNPAFLVWLATEAA
jgi:periplasmic divalent cation tolerance protein